MTRETAVFHVLLHQIWIVYVPIGLKAQVYIELFFVSSSILRIMGVAPVSVQDKDVFNACAHERMANVMFFAEDFSKCSGSIQCSETPMLTGWQRPRGASLPPFQPYTMRAGYRVSCVSVRCVVP